MLQQKKLWTPKNHPYGGGFGGGGDGGAGGGDGASTYMSNGIEIWLYTAMSSCVWFAMLGAGSESDVCVATMEIAMPATPNTAQHASALIIKIRLHGCILIIDMLFFLRRCEDFRCAAKMFVQIHMHGHMHCLFFSLFCAMTSWRLHFEKPPRLSVRCQL